MVLFVGGHGWITDWAVYLTSAVLTILIIAIGLPVKTRSSKVFKWWLGSVSASTCRL